MSAVEARNARPDLWELMGAEVREDPSLDDEQVASRVLGAARTRAELRDLVLPLVRREVQHLRRGLSRRGEERLSVVLEEPSLSAPAELRKLLRDTFGVPGRFRVTWAEATAEQHMARITYIEAQITGSRRTISRHQQALDLIRSTGKPCLRAALRS